jgi:hypothetical protein
MGTPRGFSGKTRSTLRSSSSSNNRGHGMTPPPPPPATSRHPYDGDADNHANQRFMVSSGDTFRNDTRTSCCVDDLRGGSTTTKRQQQRQERQERLQRDRLLKGTKATLSTTASYWSDAVGKAGQAVTKPFRYVGESVSSRFQPRDKKREQELLHKLETTKILSVIIVPNTTVVPTEVVQLAARRSGLIGNSLRTDRVQEFAASLKQWYDMRGYILHAVTGATLLPESATAEIQVQEPFVASQPVEIVFCKEMVVDPETDTVMTFREYKEKHRKRKTVGYQTITKADVNTTFVETAGKTRPARIARALKLQPGKPFQWDKARWKSVTTSGVFARILKASPQRLKDGSAQLQILATEAPPRHLEYGVSKSLYTGSWEGEIDFQHENVLGGGESLALLVRRGTKDPEPSITIRFSDDKFGLPGGYDIEAFSDFIGDHSNDSEGKDGSKGSSDAVITDDAGSTTPTNDPNKLLDRRGVRFTYRNPIATKRIQHSSASTSLERTATQSGIREAIGCGTLAVGPFRRELPLDARSSVEMRVTTGLRIPEGSIIQAEASPSSDDFRGGSAVYSHQRMKTLLPFTSFRITSTQVLPLLSSSLSDQPEKQPALALRHSVAGATRNLPLHEQNAMGFSSMIRGGESKGGISTFVTGSTELRIPLRLGFFGKSNAIQNLQEDASVVLFGDWVTSRKSSGSPLVFEKSIGLGVRKITQGIPLKLDFSYAGNGRIKSSFGLGRDFDV